MLQVKNFTETVELTLVDNFSLSSVVIVEKEASDYHK